MARTGALKKKGESGAAKNYITRNQAIKKLQCTLGDFRRLCILKGIYPREPRNRKKANKGSSAPASFYYSKDIQYLLHEPVLGKLREHKAFAKKLSKAIGRGEWGLAKNLEETKPVYRIDHIIKERYPTFTDSLRDLDDALSLIVLFASLPATTSIPASIITNCARLAAQWQLYVMRTKSLRKVFLSIKGIYFQAEVQGQTVTWLVPYMFTQNIPSDLDFRIMLTFLELYQTLLGFVFFKLYTDINLVYPPKLDDILDENGAGIGALLLEESGKGLVVVRDETEEDKEKKRVYAKDVRKQIREIGLGDNDAAEKAAVAEDEAMGVAPTATADDAALELDVFPVDTEAGALQPESVLSSTSLFSSYFFYLSREVTRPTLEFVIRSFGGQVGWDAVLGAGSPFDENDARITHHIVDRPVVPGAAPRQHPGKRAYVQPQWVVDCINRKTLLPTDDYAPGRTLPPHLSPFVDEDEVRERGGYVPLEAKRIMDVDMAEQEDDEDSDEDDDEDEEEDDEEEEEVDEDKKMAKNVRPTVGLGKKGKKAAPALLAAAKDPKNESLLHAAELEAEARDETKKAKKAAAEGKDKGPKKISRSQEEQLASIMLTGKQKKLYNKMTYSSDRKKEETAKLEKRRKDIAKQKAKSLPNAGL
ncbi:Pescadillo N-terminus-domain-containing protein [Leucosporidium creatinivorum]|uniref:Pescadillo homolog n=1 Tax=Leucosporidium creatinivorum TaxID=106004 RepID=A0A1Y2CY20_9BASI|nr:Pescadillo N-terminus-domain-containing protein [Leucosporidium creatinivorum]